MSRPRTIQFASDLEPPPYEVGECERCAYPVMSDEDYITGEEARGGVQHERCYDDDPE